MKKLTALLISAVLALSFSSVLVLAEPETESVVSAEDVVSVESAEETESVVSEESEEIVSAVESQNTASYTEPDEFQKEVNINEQVAKQDEGVSDTIGFWAWFIASVGMAALFVLAVAAYIKHRNRRR